MNMRSHDLRMEMIIKVLVVRELAAERSATSPVDTRALEPCSGSASPAPGGGERAVDATPRAKDCDCAGEQGGYHSLPA